VAKRQVGPCKTESMRREIANLKFMPGMLKPSDKAYPNTLKSLWLCCE